MEPNSQVRGGGVCGAGSTTFIWAHASWDNAGAGLPRSDRGGWRSRFGRSALAAPK